MQVEKNVELSSETIKRLARVIRYSLLADFYADPANRAAFERWKEERKEKNHETDRKNECKSMQTAVYTG